MDSINRQPNKIPLLQRKDGALSLYQYKPLSDPSKETRLLSISAGRNEELVTCHLLDGITFPITEGTRYETVSYVWGDKVDRSFIMLNGNLVSVPASSDAVLRQVRLKDDSRVIWIDAICINQNDNVERGQQVALMPQIYANSEGNLIHLRNDRDVSSSQRRDAMHNLRILLAQAQSETEDYRNLPETLYGDDGTWAVPTTPLPPNLDSDALAPLFSPPWFRRLWVLQEAALAPQNVCLWGTEVFDLNDILIAAVWMCYKNHLSPVLNNRDIGIVANMFDFVHPEYGYYHPRQASLDLLSVVRIGRELLVSEPRDSIFAIRGMLPHLGLQGELFSRFLTPDYDKPLGAVFADATRFMIAAQGDLNVLRLISHREDLAQASSMPSWAFRANRWFDASLDPQRLLGSFNAGGSSKVDLEILLTEGLRTQHPLCLRGVIVDTVTTVGACFGASKWEYDSALIDTMSLTITRICGSESDQHQEIIQRLASALVACATLGYENTRTWSVTQLSEYLETLMNRPTAVELSPEYRILMGRACRNKQVFSASQGLVGIGPQFTRSGDRIAVFHGGGVPFVLRPFGAGYQLLGEAYVEGIMEGEALQDHEGDASKASILEIH